MEHAELLMKKRSQMKQVQSVIVQEAVRAVELAPSKEVKVQLCASGPCRICKEEGAAFASKVQRTKLDDPL